MSRVNWVEGLALFAEDWRRTGVSPEKWCNEKGYPWGTAKKYITIKKAKALLGLQESEAEKNANSRISTAKKNANKTTNSRSVKSEKKSDKIEERVSIIPVEKNNTEDFFLSFNPADFGLSEKQGIFAECVAAGKKLVDAYRIAGYKGEGSAAYVTASQLLRNPKVFRAVSFLRDKRQQRLSLTEEEIIHQLSAIASANPNELVQYRRVNCRHCWGEHHLYQWKDIEEFDKAAEKASKDGKEEPEYGGLGFVESAFPNEECPKCNGEGVGQFHAADTSLLEGDARWLYAGVKQTLNGFEVRMANQEAARRDLLKIIEVRKNRISKNGDGESGEEETDISDEQLNEALRGLGYGRFSDQLSDRETPPDDQE